MSNMQLHLMFFERTTLNSEEFATAIAEAHQTVEPGNDAEAFGLRLTELGSLIGETMGVFQQQGAEVAQRHALATLETPHYASLLTLLSTDADVWTMFDPSAAGPDQFIENLWTVMAAFPDTFVEVMAKYKPAEVVDIHRAETKGLQTSLPPAEIVTINAPSGPVGNALALTTDEGRKMAAQAAQADETQLRLQFRKLAENNKQLVGELVKSRRELHDASALATTLEVFGEEGKAKAVEFFQKEFLYAYGGASPALLTLIRRQENKFLWDLLRGRVNDADYGRYLRIFLEILRDVLVNAA